MQVGHGHTERPYPACGVALRFARFRLLRILLTLSLIGVLAFVPVDFRFREVQLNNVKSPLLEIHQNEAYAIPAAIPAAGAALAALAAELGISETALVAGICAIGVGVTGLAVTNSAGDWTDTGAAPVPGWAPWDDLPDAVKDKYRGYDNPPQKEYYDNAVAWWGIQYGLLQDDGNGGLEPTPDPEDGGNGSSNWQEKRNVLIALATGVGGVALYDALAPFVDGAAASVKELLFGNDDNGYLGLSYTQTIPFGNTYAVFEYLDVSGTGTVNIGGVQTEVSVNSNNWYSRAVGTAGGYRNPVNFFSGASVQTIDLTERHYIQDYWLSGDLADPNIGHEMMYQQSNGNWTFSHVTGSLNCYTPFYIGNGNIPATLNAAYSGTYTFPGGYTYSNGSWVGTVPQTDIDYGQYADTPEGLSQNIMNNTNLMNFFNNYTDPNVDNYTRALAIPSWLVDGSGNPNSEYADFVTVLPDEDIITIPSDEPLTPPTPNPGSQYQQDFGQQVGRLLAQPFTQLFPFCLITDLYDLTQVIEGSLYTNDGLRTQSNTNGTDVLVIPLDDFGIDGMEDIELDLTDIRSFGLLIRPWTTALFITALLVGSFRFFLNRGGE